MDKQIDRHMDRLRVGVVGLGHNGCSFASGYQQSDQAELVALCDLSPERIQMAIEHASADEHVGRYTRLEEMLEAEKLDVLSVHTPDHLHAEPFCMGLQAGCHVLVEKPMGNTMDDLVRMTHAAANNSKQKTMVGHILRFNPFFAEVHRLCAAGELGEIFYLTADYIHHLKYQGDDERINPHIGSINWYLEHEKVLVGGGVHQFDLLRWYCGSNAVEVMGYGNSIAFPEMKQPDCMTAVFRMASGAVARVTGAYGIVGPRPRHCNLEVYGTEGTVRDGKVIRGTGHDQVTIEDISDRAIDGHPYEPEIEHFLDCIIQDKPTLVDAFEGASSAVATILAVEAIMTGEPQAVPRFAS